MEGGIMNLRELFEKIYNNEIKEDDVIVQKDLTSDEYDQYIVNDNFDFWYNDGDSVISLNFFNKENEDFKFEIISKKEFMNLIDRKYREEKIKRLEEELKIEKSKL
jgi:hypothetical protein